MLPYITVANIQIPMYGLCMALGILTASFVAYRRIKRFDGDINSLIIIIACAIGGALLGAKLLYIVASFGLANAWRLMLEGDFSFLANSGLVFYGGLIFGIFGGWLGSKIARESFAQYCNALVPCIALGHAFGRLGCLFAGCCHGMPYNGPFSLSFPAVGISYQTFPVQILELLINLGIFVFLLFYTRKNRCGYTSLLLYLIIYAVSRFSLEFLRGDAIRGIANGLSTSQWISIGLFAVSLLLMLCRRAPKHKH